MFPEPDRARIPFFESYSRPGSGLRRFRVAAMGTEVVLLLAGDDGDDGDDGVAEVAQAAFDRLASLEQRLSKFLPESEVSLLNGLGARQEVFVSAELIDILELSREAWDVTGGAFDPTVGPLLEAWGLVDLAGNVPSDDEIRGLLEVRGMDLIETCRERSTARLRRGGVSVDLGAIGKGYAVDQVVALAREAGVVAGAVVAGRSTIATWGSPPAGHAWRVALSDPVDVDEVVEEREAAPGVVSSSGAAERFFRARGSTYGHVLDPRTGRPVSGLLGATVWTRTAVLGDVLSTSLFVLGADAAREGGPLAELARRWAAPGEEARASFLWFERDSGAWGGRRVEERHVGEPALSRPREG